MKRVLVMGALALIQMAIEEEERNCPVHKFKDWEQDKRSQEAICTCAHRKNERPSTNG